MPAKKKKNQDEELEPKKRGRKKKTEDIEDIEDFDEDDDETELFQFSDEHGTQRGLTVIFFFSVAILSFLAFIDAAGDLGVWIDTGLGWLFGWGRYMMTVVFAALGYVLLHPSRYQVRAVNWVGSVLCILALLALIHLWIPLPDSLTVLQDGRGGGLFGVLLAYPLLKYAGIWASVVVLFALLIASVLMTFQTSLNALLDVLGSVKLLAKPVQWIRQRITARRYGYVLDDGTEDDEEEWEEDEELLDEDVEEELLEEEVPAFTSAELAERTSEAAIDPSSAEQLEFVPQKPKRRRTKVDMPLDLLVRSTDKPMSGDIEGNKEKIRSTFENFRIDVEMEEVSVGPMVTQYALKPAQGVKLTQITSLSNDLALALAAHPIRIEAPIPGKSQVGIEVPNKTTATVRLRDLLESKEFKKREDNLMFCIGRDVSGKTAMVSVNKMPHVLIAGATGSGKSVGINSLIVSLLYQNSPDDLKFIMVDPKRVELSVYNGIPHLLTPVITDVEKTVNSLKWAVTEMDRRYEVLSRAGKRNIEGYNTAANNEDRMPYIVFIIDELADIMSVASSSVEAAIVRLSQMSRAVGIHLVLATQRPSVNVITGLIKANMPTRIAFAVTSLVDSRTILDFSGAEKLLGRGDMLYIDPSTSKPRRYQGAYIDENEIEKVVEFLKEEAGEPDYNSDITEKISAKGIPGMVSDGMGSDEDELLEEAKKVLLQAGKASASLLQRRLRVGYARAARILDILEEEGFIGPAEGSKPREILATEVDLGPADDEEMEGDEFSEAEDDADESEDDDVEDDEEEIDDLEDSDEPERV